MTGMYYTPGWGALATTTVAVVAVVVSAIGNWIALRRSADQFATNQETTQSRFRAEQAERVSNQQRASMVDVIHCATKWMSTLTVVSSQMARIATAGAGKARVSAAHTFRQDFLAVHMVVASDFERALTEAEILATDEEVLRVLKHMRESHGECFAAVDAQMKAENEVHENIRALKMSFGKLGEQMVEIKSRSIALFRPRSQSS
ncbi:hypothetical protein [Prescottella agglutinans]|uniref:Uncharacterized protein n=1 Tax=Prescottella agglutinans TaxID=1644129 RepID=A0ABT6MB10_9NOCA|nr:hypothetical protein [Prescottella agglutinans]MDH6280986.1 hypothetical protein [Prescottella agglutinans]